MDTQKGISRPGYSNYVVSSSSESDDDDKGIQNLPTETENNEREKQGVDESSDHDNTLCDKNLVGDKSSDHKTDKEVKKRDAKERHRSRSRDRDDRDPSKIPRRDDRDEETDERSRHSRDHYHNDDRRHRHSDDRGLSRRYGEDKYRRYDKEFYDRSKHHSHRSDDRGDRSRRDDERDYVKSNARRPPARQQPKRKDFQETSNKLKEQVEKRKMLWQQSTKEKKVADHWSAMLSTCSDEKQAEKLKKLIGLKDADDETTGAADGGSTSTESKSGSCSNTVAPTPLSEGVRQRQEELFRNLNQQYEMGRMSTHTHRGVGLGFSSQMNEYAAQLHGVQNPQPSNDK